MLRCLLFGKLVLNRIPANYYLLQLKHYKVAVAFETHFSNLSKRNNYFLPSQTYFQFGISVCGDSNRCEKYSSAKFYLEAIDDIAIITHYSGN